jgi:soluble lytic murein transglycosylase-like protein
MRHCLFIGVLAATLASAQTKPAATPAPGKAPAVSSATATPAPASSQTSAATQSPALTQTQTPAIPPPTQDANNVQSAMAESLAKQRMSLIKQVASAMGKPPTPAPSFYTVPWVETPVPFSSPPCDPVPEPELTKLVQESAQQEGVKPELIRAVIAEESGARPCAVSWKGAQGLMQLMPATSEQFGVKDPFDPRQSVEAGTKLLKQLLAKYNNDVSLALAAYNAGEGRVDKDGGVPQIPETQHYVTDIQSKLTKE